MSCAYPRVYYMQRQTHRSQAGRASAALLSYRGLAVEASAFPHTHCPHCCLPRRHAEALAKAHFDSLVALHGVARVRDSPVGASCAKLHKCLWAKERESTNAKGSQWRLYQSARLELRHGTFALLNDSLQHASVGEDVLDRRRHRTILMNKTETKSLRLVYFSLSSLPPFDTPVSPVGCR